MTAGATCAACAAAAALLALGLAAPAAGADAVKPAQPATPAAEPHTLESVIVPGHHKPMKKCREDDKACIAAVIAVLKEKYPEQLKVWCFRQKMNEMRDHVNAATYFGGSGDAATLPGGGANATIDHAPVIQTVCATEKAGK